MTGTNDAIGCFRESDKVEKYIGGLADMDPWPVRTPHCYECGNQGHYKSDCPELKNGNQAGGARTRGMVLALVGGEPNQDLDDMEDNTNA
ncbi:reverse transcriptase domain-containing protein [Tanacetum coccineum]